MTPVRPATTVKKVTRAVVLFALFALVPASDASAQSLLVNGRTRTYLLEQPSAQGPRPTVIMLHEAFGNAAGIARASGIAQVAPQQGLVAVFPQSLAGGTWNIYPPGKEPPGFLQRSQETGGLPDDVAFLKALVADLVQRGVSDPKRIYLAGTSNGGFMTLRMICVDAGTFAAIGLLISGMPEPTGADCRPAKPIPAVMIRGTADQVVPHGGGLMRTLSIWPTDRLVDFLRKLDNCVEPAQQSILPGQLPKKVEIESSVKCSGGPVVLYRVVGGGHDIPPLPNAAQLLLEFFRDKVRS
jgi:polyhydroxybutyrate depolymerase